MVAENRLFVSGIEKRQWAKALRQFRENHLIDPQIHLGFKVVYPEFIEVAEYCVSRTPWHEPRPIVERSSIVLREIRPAAFHLD